MSSVPQIPFLSIHHATVRYLDKILFPSLSFTIYKNEHWAVTGKSGSGKTALLQTIMGKYNIVNGGISYPFYESFIQKHHIPDSLFTYRHLIAMVSQQARFRNKQNMSDFFYQQRFHAWYSEEASTVKQYITDAFASVNQEISKAKIRFPMEWVVNNMKLEELLNKTLIQLSNGETRRLMIAQALLQQPLLLMLDNPFTGLDKQTRPFFDQLLTQITSKGTQLLIATSALEIPECITDVLELDNGKIVDRQSRRQYLEQYKAKDVSKWKPDPQKLAQLMQNAESDTPAFEKAISMQNIQVKYGDSVILDKVNWEIARGEKWALSGPNGAGKSTLLSLISGDNPQAYANTIYLFDKKRGSGESIWDIKRKIGFVSPEMHQYFHSNHNCLEVILSGYSDTIGIVPKKIYDQPHRLAVAQDWMELLNIHPLKSKKFKSVSAGAQRLILLIRALVKNPPLLILDEPCQGLDQEQKDQFLNVIEQICDNPDKTLIYVTHYAEEVPRCVQHILHLNKGKVDKV